MKEREERRNRWRPLRIVRSESFETKQKVIRELVLKIHGNRESVLELGGVVKGQDIIITDGLIPRASISGASFSVQDRDLSACWGEAEKNEATSHLRPCGDMHYHPESCSHLEAGDGPRPSPVDLENSYRQASLYFPFNLQTIAEERVLAPEPAAGDGGGSLRYRVDRFRSLHLSALQGEPTFNLVLKEQRQVAHWASLIRPCNGGENHVHAAVTTHEYRDDELRVQRYNDVDTIVLNDAEVAELAGWPLENVRLALDREDLERQVRERYRVDNYHYWPAARHDHWTDSWWDSYDDSWAVSPWYRRRTYPSPSAPRLPRWDGHELHYLTASSGLSEVARLLRESAALVGGEGMKEFEYLHERAERAEIVRALRECVRLLRGSTSPQRSYS